MSRKRDTTRDALLIAGLARGLSVKRAAERAGVNVRTAFRRLENPEFQAQVSRARGQLHSRVAGLLAAGGIRAVKALVKLLDSDTDKIRLQAARGVLAHQFRAAEFADLAEQVEQLKARVHIYVPDKGRS
jgi:hypothetical protein